MFCRICIPGESGAWSCRQVQREERQEQGFRHRKPKSQAGFSPSSLKSISGIFKTRVFAAAMLSAGPKLRLGPMDIGPKQKERGKIKVICPIGKNQCIYYESVYTLIFLNFIFILVYFSAHNFRIFNNLRQLMYGAGGFSYKSMWTLRELFPLINFGCKFCQIATKNIHISARFGYEFGKMAHN